MRESRCAGEFPRPPPTMPTIANTCGRSGSAPATGSRRSARTTTSRRRAKALLLLPRGQSDRAAKPLERQLRDRLFHGEPAKRVVLVGFEPHLSGAAPGCG